MFFFIVLAPELAIDGFWVRILLAPFRFGTLAIPFTPLCQCLSKETLKASGCYLVSLPGVVKYPTQGVNVSPVVNSTTLK